MFPDPMRAFLLVVQTGSVRKASERLGLNPSSVSRQIVVLERQCGTALFRRDANRLTVTDAGAIVADYAEATVTGFDSLRSDIDDLRGRQRLITVAMVESITSAGPAAAAERFRRSHPGVSFDFHVVPAPEVIEAVRHNRCDLGIAFCSRPAADIRVVARAHEPVVLLAPADLDLGRGPIGLAVLAAQAIALPQRAFGIRQILEDACAAQGVAIRPTMETNSFEALRDFVRAGAGVALVPFRAAIREAEGGRARLYGIDHPAFRDSTLDLIVATGQRLPRLTHAFIEDLRHAMIAEHPVAPIAT
jgi:DNA-binding transcriptional LysR family regulator